MLKTFIFDDPLSKMPVFITLLVSEYFFSLGYDLFLIRGIEICRWGNKSSLINWMSGWLHIILTYFKGSKVSLDAFFI